MKLNQFILRTFNIKPEESQIFILLFFHSFFLVGVFISIYFVPANGLFIHNFGSKQLPIAYICAGIMGYLASMAYSYIQKRVNSRTLFIGVLTFMAILPVLMRVSLYFFPDFEKNMSFFGFVWAWPFISLVAMENSGLSIKLLNLRQVKRLFGAIGIGGILASIISYFAIPAITPFLSHQYDLFYLASAGVIVSMYILIRLYRKFPEITEEEIDTEAVKKITVFSLFKEKYFRLIFLTVVLTLTTLYFTDYGYLSSIKIQKSLLPSPKDVTNFIAVVCGVFKIGELLLSYFSSRILSSYGVKLGLTIMPYSLLILIAVASIFSMFLGPESIIFFGIIVITKSTERILRRGLDDPSFNILYQPLAEEMKLTVQTKVGIVMQLSIGIAGALLWLVSEALTINGEFQLRYYTLSFLPFLVIYVYVSKLLYSSYRDKLRQILVDKNKKGGLDIRQNLYGTDILVKHLQSNELKKVRMSVTILSETNHLGFEPFAQKLLESRDNTIIRAILRNIDPLWNKNLLPQIQKIANETNSEQTKELAKQACEYLDFTDMHKRHDALSEIHYLSSATQIVDKIRLVKYLSIVNPKDVTIYIKELLNQDDRIIKQAAIKLAGKNATHDLKVRLTDLLKTTEFHHISSKALEEIGESVVPELDSVLKDHNNPEFVIFKVIEILARIGTPNAQSVLLSEINYPNKDIQTAIIQALFYSNYQANDRERIRVKEQIERLTEYILWIFVTINDLEHEKNTLKLKQSLEIEREICFENLFRLLSFIYQPATIDLIKQNIIGENTIFALEIIDNFIATEIKQLIIPLLDNISVNQRVKKLYVFFPHKKMKFVERLKDILTRDYNKVDLWSVAKAIELLGKIYKNKHSNEIKAAQETVESEHSKLWTRELAYELLDSIRKSEMPDEIFVSLYHPDEIVYSTAAKVIFEENPIRCANYLKKLSPKKQKMINFLSIEGEEAQILIDKVKVIKRIPIFFSIPESKLIKLAKLLKPYKLKKGEQINFDEKIFKKEILIILRGMVVCNDGASNELQLNKNDIVIRGLNIPRKTPYMLVRKDTLIVHGNRFNYFNLLIDETEILRHMFDMLEFN